MLLLDHTGGEPKRGCGGAKKLEGQRTEESAARARLSYGKERTRKNRQKINDLNMAAWGPVSPKPHAVWFPVHDNVGAGAHPAESGSLDKRLLEARPSIR